MSIFLIYETICPVLLLPVIMLLYGRKRGFGIWHTELYLFFSLYTAAVYYLTGLPDAAYHPFDVNVDLRLFVGMAESPVSSILNIFLFLPLGFFLCLLCDRFVHWKQTMAFGFWMSLTIELLQLFTLRATDVNDLATNTLGAALGGMAAAFLIRAKPGLAVHGSVWDIVVPMTSAVCVMYFVQPLISALLM